jgi:hypothetical protein
VLAPERVGNDDEQHADIAASGGHARRAEEVVLGRREVGWGGLAAGAAGALALPIGVRTLVQRGPRLERALQPR